MFLTYLDFSAYSDINMKTVNICGLFLFFYLPAPPDNPAVHGDTREPPVYS